MTSPVRPEQHSVPIAYAEQLVQLVRRWDIAADDLLSAIGLREKDLEQPQRRLGLVAFGTLIEHARELTGEPGLGFYLGLQKRISAYGYLGFAAMSASSLREALELFIRFTPTLTTSIGLRLHVEGRVASLIVEELADLGRSRDVAILSLVVGIRQIGRVLTGQDLEGDHAELSIPEPPYFSRFKHLAPHMTFGHSVSRVVFDASYLDLPLVQADPAALRLVREQCERALDELGYQGDFVERVRKTISDGEVFRSLDEVAPRVGVSARTLKRKLAAQGVSFSTLLDQERRERAVLLLSSPRASLEQIAERLGYSTPSNFVRAFHRWTGSTPAAYRRARGIQQQAPLRVLRTAPYA